MPVVNSPLRYPGGKAILAEFLAGVVEVNGISDGIYIEPYAGGAGAALNLLFGGYVERIIINDADQCVFAFWRAILTQTERFLSLVDETPVTIEEWQRQRAIYLSPSRHSNIKVGFATFFLNRCNRSGILMNGGPIGGLEQTGKWKVNARYNAVELKRRITKIALFREQISVFNLDAIDFLRKEVLPVSVNNEVLVYFDPPYYEKGSMLYLNHYEHDDHELLARFINENRRFKWVMSYDNVPEIRQLYADKIQIAFDLKYSAHTVRIGKELLIHDEMTKIPLNGGRVKIAERTA